MSAPDTNALPPAPVTTTTRTSSSLAKSSRMRVPACHISSDTALWRAGLLKVMVPTRPSLRANILSVLGMGSPPGLAVRAALDRHSFDAPGEGLAIRLLRQKLRQSAYDSVRPYG